MLTAGEVFENPRTGARLEVRAREPDRLEVERVYKPHTGKADPHVHLDFDQWFEVIDGAMSLTLDGQAREYGPGDSVHVPRGVPHVDAWNASDADLRVRARFEPLPEFVEGYTAALGAAMRNDDLNKQGEFRQLQLFTVLRAYHAQSYTSRLPIGLQKAAIPVLAAIGRMRGYRVQT